MPLTLIFMGTPEFSVPTLEAVLAAGHKVVAAYTQPPRPAGRGLAARKSTVHAAAEASGIPVLTPRSLRGAAEQQVFAGHGADTAVVVAYGLILPKAILEAPRHGCLNGHASRLPRWRGAAPIQRAIMAGDRETAATVMRMEEGLDTGPVCLERPLPIEPDMTAGELHDRLAVEGAAAMVEALSLLEKGKLSCRPQPETGVTYAQKIDKAETRIDFSRSAAEVHNLIRGLSPFPGAWLEAIPAGGAPERLKVLRSRLAAGSDKPGEVLDDRLTIACGSGAVRLLEVQRAGKRVMSAEELLRGFALGKGTHLPVA
jgi:methionyl-tRNA formyltransferase